MAKTSGQLERERITEKKRRASIITITDFSKCYCCKSIGLKETDLFCPNCGFPQRGTQAEMKKFVWNINNKKKLIEDLKKAVNKARNILYFLGTIYLLMGLFLGLATKKDISILIGGILGAVVFFVLGLWSRKHPFPAILSGFFVYIVFIVISAVADPQTLFQGFIVKGFIISGFIYGYKGVKDSQKLEADLESIKKAKDLNIIIEDELSQV